ncbi:hypothetical protein [Sphingomonas colocasiae]|uniref:Uncharacterized protein n=1 Tax=Sphingomonas colocasiae TaxID=1848973 RepID=A0ABS7PY77_9SPHN|nr:hypothetical protein [Sphingomonas colocasiae]MBY8826096.1 hypothetical protein [Sphingomonas colocasiae]
MTDVTYACVGGPPDNWFNLLIVDADGVEIRDVVEVNAAEGWLVRCLRDANGRPIPGDDGYATERLEGQFRIERKPVDPLAGLCAETIATERAAVKAYAADHRRRIEVQIARGRLTADEGTLLAKQVDVFAEGVAIGLHMEGFEPREVRVAVRAALSATGLDGRAR